MDKLLRRLRVHLNRIIVLYRALTWMGWGALVSGLVVAVLRVFSFGNAALSLWGLIVAASAAAGAVAARSSLLDERDTARWIDTRLGEHELISAAETCLRRLRAGRFDEEILARASLLASRVEELRPPLRALAKRGTVSFAALALGAYAIFLAAPIDFGLDAGGRSPGGATKSGAWGGSAAQAFAAGESTAAEFASSLFPEDKRMATLAERALREGRIDDFAQLMDAAGLALDSKLAGTVSEAERRKLIRERERIALAVRTVSGRQARPPSRGRQPGNRSDGEGAAEGRSDDYAPPDRDGPPSSRGEGGSGDREADSSGATDQGGDGPDEDGRGEESYTNKGRGLGEHSPQIDGTGGALGRGKEDWGLGTGKTAGDNPVDSKSPGEEAVIRGAENPSYFELVLPGEKAATPLGSIVPSARRTAESAVSHGALPLEYEDFIESYFMALSKGEER